MAPHTTYIASKTPLSSPPNARGPSLTQSECKALEQHNHDLLFAFLTDAEGLGYSGPVDRVEMVQSVLFLAGPHCYKSRRVTPKGSKDVLSLHARCKLACEEVRLGKKFAPDLHYQLVAIRRLGERIFFHLPDVPYDEQGLDDVCQRAIARGNAPITDWLVKTRRYDFSKSLEKQIEVYQPNFSDCHRLAELIAPNPADDHGDKPAQSWLSHLTDLLDGLAPLVRQLDRAAKQTTLRACLRRASERLEKIEPVIKLRGERGLIGQIHGNVRLSNVVELAGGFRLVNPQVSRNGVTVREWQGDQFFDLASLVGELWSRGLARQANWVLSHYCNRLLDIQMLNGLEALDVYLLARSLERADTLTTAITAKRTQRELFKPGCRLSAALRSYLKTARDSLLQDEATLFVIGGSSQRNRSNLARLLAPVTGRMPGALYLSAQEEMQVLYGVNSNADLPPSADRQSVWNLAYRRLSEKAQLALKAGYSVILEGRFDCEASRQHVTALAHVLGRSQSVMAFHLFDPQGGEGLLSEQTLDAHFNKAPRDAASRGSDRMLERLDVMQEELPILGIGNGFRDWTSWIELDASRSVGDLLGQALRHINPAWTPTSNGTMH